MCNMKCLIDVHRVGKNLGNQMLIYDNKRHRFQEQMQTFIDILTKLSFDIKSNLHKHNQLKLFYYLII